MLRNDHSKAAENQRREAELRWETGPDGQPLYCIDRQGMVL
jgi:hypothetical protein